MSNDLTQALRTAHSGLIASQQSLDAVARNVANVHTPGYSRKIVNLEQRTLAGAGAGVQFGALTRRIDQGLLNALRQESGSLQATTTEESFLQRVQDLFGTPESNTSLSHSLGGLQAAVETLALAPQDPLGQRAVVSAGADTASLLRRSSSAFQDMRREADQLIGTRVGEINGLLQSVEDLNDKIVRNYAIGQSIADLEDTRGQALDRLAELMDIRAVVRNAGDVVVFTAGGRTLVDGTAVSLSHAAASNAGAGVTYAGGFFDGIYIGDKVPGNDITLELQAGELAGLIKTRDITLPDLQSALDELAARLRDTVNAVHNRGTGFPGLTAMNGSRAFTDPATQSITFGGTADTALVLFDAAGNAVGQTTVRTLLTPAGSATATIDDLATALNGALAGAVSAQAVNGRLTLSVATPGLTLALRDQATSTAGGAAQDAVIGFDSDGVGGADQTFAGFSSFFGLNDFFVDGQGQVAARTGVAAGIDVRADIQTSPARVSRGAVQWDASRLPAGRYTLAIGDDTVVQQLTTALAATSDFAVAGRLGATNTGFTEYAAALIGDASQLASAIADTAAFQTDFVDALKQKSDSVRGVNLDEELSDLMLYEQAYAAAARVVSVVQQMFDALDRALA